MIVNTKILEQQIIRYVKREITKNELGVWAMLVYQDLMRGEYIEIDKLAIYHFIRTISFFHRGPDDMADEYPSTEKEILEIKEILQGKKDICYTFRVRICEFIYKMEKYKSRLKQFETLYNLFDSFCVDKLSSVEIDKLMKYCSQRVSEQTLVDLLEMHIKGIIIENYDADEHIFSYRQSVGIYTGGSDINEVAFQSDIKKVLECAMGKRDFRVTIIYKKGVFNIMFVL